MDKRKYKAEGTHRVGLVALGYDYIKSKLGDPMPAKDIKSDAEWRIIDPAVGMITIYNYKNGISYLGPEGTPVAEIGIWHVGGHWKTEREAERIMEKLEEILEISYE